MAYIVSGTDLTSVANAIRTAGGTSAQLEFPSGFVTAIGNISGGGGGGATNIVHGSFTPATSEKGTVKAVTISYTGSGYPVLCVIYPHGGYNENVPVYNSTHYNGAVMQVIVKSNSTTPDYSTSNTEKNWALISGVIKNSASDPTSILSQVSKGTIEFTSYSPNGIGTVNTVRFSSATQMNVFVADSSYGFLDGQEYDYLIVYSS